MYFDYMATTPIDNAVIEKMLNYMGIESCFGNPSSKHELGFCAMEAVDNAREQVAKAINATPDEIIWTSGATESNNIAIKGASTFYKRRGNHLITVKTEHRAVLDCFKYLESQGFDVSYLKPQSNGLLSLDTLKGAIREDTIFCSVMLVNNEIGVIQPIAEIGKFLMEKGIIFHVDAAQAPGKMLIDVKALNVNLMSFSGHKLYGPKGAGVLYLCRKPRARLSQFIHGGGQEQGIRSGTLATHQIVGIGEAFALSSACYHQEIDRIGQFHCRLKEGLLNLGGIHFNGDELQRVPHNLSFSVEGVDGDSLIYALGGLCVSSTSACSSASIEPSHVLKEIGVDNMLAHSTVRLSIGRFTTTEDIDSAINVISLQVKRLRELSV